VRTTDRGGRLKGRQKEMKHSLFPGKIFVSFRTIMEALYNTAHDIGVDYTKLLTKFISGNMATLPNAQNVSQGPVDI